MPGGQHRGPKLHESAHLMQAVRASLYKAVRIHPRMEELLWASRVPLTLKEGVF